MKPRTLDLILKACLIGIVLDLPMFFFDVLLGTFILIVLTAVLLFSGWKAWKLFRTNPDAFKTPSEREKELSLKDLPPRLIIVLVAALVIALLSSFSVFSFDPFIDTMLVVVAVLLVVYYFFQKRKLRKKVQ